MKFVCTREYKGFRTDFYILEKTNTYLQRDKIDLNDYLPDAKTWYEQVLFGILKEYFANDWDKQKDKKKNFKVIYYGIIEKAGSENAGNFTEKFDFKNLETLEDCLLVINKDNEPKLAIKEKIIILK